MTMTHEAQLKALLAHDSDRMHVLQAVAGLGLSDCWVGAGFVRSLVWDYLHHRECSPLPEDIDVIWYDPARADRELDSALEEQLSRFSKSWGGLKNR